MYRFLIVDDEPEIVDSLYELFVEDIPFEIEVYRAYNVYEALDFLRKTRIDLVVTDIRMPGMSGIELHRQIVGNWPRCKVIFLSGYNDFEYARDAIRNGSVIDYVLKTEDDDMIISAVERAVKAIEQADRAEEYELKAKMNMNIATQILRKKYFLGLMDSLPPSQEIMASDFARLEIQLLAEKPVYLVIGRIDEWPAGMEEATKKQLCCTLQNIAEEHLSVTMTQASIEVDGFRTLWLVQPKSITDSNQNTIEEEWKNLISKMNGIMEAIQNACRQHLKITVSFAACREPCTWERISTNFFYLKMLLGQGLGGGGRELLIQESETVRQWMGTEQAHVFSGLQRLRQDLELLEKYLESGQKEAFFDLYEEMMVMEISQDHTHQTELFYSISLCLLSYAKRSGLFHELLQETKIEQMMRIDAHESWGETVQYFKHVAKYLFMERQSDPEERAGRVIQMLHSYIQDHMNEELTLTKLSSLVYHSPTYLSRLYKRTTGMKLFDYITEQRMRKAAVMLVETNMKINEIAAAVGYETAAYFTLTFKKMFRVTPQEYRTTVHE